MIGHMVKDFECRKIDDKHKQCQDERSYFVDEQQKRASVHVSPKRLSQKFRALTDQDADLRPFAVPMKPSRYPNAIVIAALLPLSLTAQEPRNGPKIGVDIGTQTAGQFLAWNGLPKLGFIGGWSFEAPITSQVSLLIEPMYIGKGSVTVDSRLKTRGSIALNYLELPLLLKVSTNPDPQGLFISGGIMYGYFLYGKVRNYQYGALINSYDFSPSNSTNRGQWSAALGIGHEMGHWMWELRGQSSLNTFDTYVRSHNVVYSLQVAWRFSAASERDKKRNGKVDDQD